MSSLVFGSAPFIVVERVTCARVAPMPRFCAGTHLTPQRNQPRDHDNEIDLARKRFQHRERLANAARWYKVAIPDCGERCIAEEQIVIGRRVRLARKERSRT